MEQLTLLFLAQSPRWSGCDWDTVFGECALNLKGLHSGQAEVIARATAGVEAERWRAAARWLLQVEQDAARAEREGRAAAEAASRGDWSAARAHVAAACALEAAYPDHHPVWTALRLALEVENGPGRGSRCCLPQPSSR